MYKQSAVFLALQGSRALNAAWISQGNAVKLLGEFGRHSSFVEIDVLSIT
jgi:hypothetical protein